MSRTSIAARRIKKAEIAAAVAELVRHARRVMRVYERNNYLYYKEMYEKNGITE